jgi:predicted nucleotidyltransferase
MENTSQSHSDALRQWLPEIVRRIVETAAPERIILFGSVVRGEVTRDSDIDLLVVKSNVAHRRKLAQDIHIRLFGIPVPVDVVVATPQDRDRGARDPWNIYGEALREGQEIYAV